MDEINWREINGEFYESSWQKTLACRILSEKEKKFIRKFLPYFGIKALDFGIGAGRILNVLLENTSPDAELYGLDISESMVRYCQEKFGKNPKIKGLKVVKNWGSLNFDYQTKFNFITAIRVLKYNKNWREILKNLFEILQQDGIIIFTMPNKYSLINIPGLKKFCAKVYKASIGEIKKIARENNMKIIEIRGFERIPGLYSINNKLVSKILLYCENILSFIFGNKFLVKEVFYVLRK
jgi:SAM-dependent methyltransferase